MGLHLVSSSWRMAGKGPIQPKQHSVLRLPTAGRLATPAMPSEPRTQWPSKGLWRNGSASDSRSEGWEFESLWPHFFLMYIDHAHKCMCVIMSNCKSLIDTTCTCEQKITPGQDRTGDLQRVGLTS